jgi:hypothetical protein
MKMEKGTKLDECLMDENPPIHIMDENESIYFDESRKIKIKKT